MNIQNHVAYQVPKLAFDAETTDQMNRIVLGVLHLRGYDKAEVNAVLATLEPDQIICMTTTLCGETHAGISVLRDGKPTYRLIERFPLLSHDAALGEALRMMDEIVDEWSL